MVNIYDWFCSTSKGKSCIVITVSSYIVSPISHYHEPNGVIVCFMAKFIEPLVLAGEEDWLVG